MPPRGRNRRPKRGLSGAFIVMGIMSLLYSGVFPLFRLFDYAVLALVMLGAGKIYRAVVKKIHQKEDEAAEEEERRERQREEYARKRREAEEKRKAEEEIRGQIAAQARKALFIRRARREQPPQPRPQRPAQPHGQSRLLHGPRQRRPKADGPCQRQRQLDPCRRAGKRRLTGRKRLTGTQISQHRQEDQTKPKKVQQHV